MTTHTSNSKDACGCGFWPCRHHNSKDWIDELLDDVIWAQDEDNSTVGNYSKARQTIQAKMNELVEQAKAEVDKYSIHQPKGQPKGTLARRNLMKRLDALKRGATPKPPKAGEQNG